MKKTRNLTYGAMIVVIISMAVLLDRSVAGFLGAVMSIAICVPLNVYGTLFSLRDTVVVYVTAIFASVIVSGMLGAVVSVIGYGLISLIYVHCLDKNYSKKVRSGLMFIGMVLLYTLMIGLFNEYFGVDLKETVEVLGDFFSGLSSSVLMGFALMSVLLTLVMELYIINTLSELIEKRLKLSFKK